jgi:clan AA aspartic protease
MIIGTVANLEATIQIEIRDRTGALHLLLAIVDTGYNGHLTLPQSVISSHGLASSGKLRAMLADGTIVSMNTYIAEIQWFDTLRKVVVTEAEGGPLIGMGLLEGSRMILDVTENGRVIIESLEHRS